MVKRHKKAHRPKNPPPPASNIEGHRGQTKKEIEGNKKSDVSTHVPAPPKMFRSSTKWIKRYYIVRTTFWGPREGSKGCPKARDGHHVSA